MVLLPCSNCCCDYPYTGAVSEVEVVTESTGSDAYWSFGANGPTCATKPGGGARYEDAFGQAAYAPRAATYSLSYGGINTVFQNGQTYVERALYAYTDGYVSLAVYLYGSVPSPPTPYRARIGVSTVAFKSDRLLSFGAASGVDIPDYSTGTGSTFFAYGFSVDQVCDERSFSCATSPYNPSSPWIAASIIHTPTQDETYAEFGASTYVKTALSEKNVWFPPLGCGGPAAFTDGASTGTQGTAVAATLKIARVTVKYSDGKPDMDIM